MSAKSPMRARSNQPQRFLFDKDVLRVGHWRVGNRVWDVTPAVLRRLVINFQRARAHGIRVPVVWNHSHDARDKLGEIIRLYVSQSTLRARFWAADPFGARQLALSEGEASVEVAEPWIDGTGRRYDIFMTHLAIVNHPVVSGQGPPWRLSLAGNEQLQEGEPSMPEATTLENNTTDASTNVTITVDLINEIVSALGTSHRLAEDTTADNFAERLRDLRDRIEAMVIADSEVETSQLSLEERLDRVSRELARERREALLERQERFQAGIDRLIHEGRLHASDKEGLLEAGEPTGYSLSLLAPFERLPLGAAVPVTNRARRAANAKPTGSAARLGMSDDRARAIVREYTP